MTIVTLIAEAGSAPHAHAPQLMDVYSTLFIQLGLLVVGGGDHDEPTVATVLPKNGHSLQIAAHWGSHVIGVPIVPCDRLRALACSTLSPAGSPARATSSLPVTGTAPSSWTGCGGGGFREPRCWYQRPP